MWQFLISLLTSPLIKAGLEAYKTKLQLENSDDQRAMKLLEQEIQADIAARAEATKLLIAEQGNWITRSVRPLFALPFILFAFKVVVWDKVLHLGVTDALDPHMWVIFNTIIVSYFGATAVERVARIFKR